MTSSGLTKSQSVLPRTLSKCLLNTDGPGALTTSLGKLFQCLSTLLVKKCFLMSTQNVQGHSFEPVPQVLDWISGRRDQQYSLQLPSSGSCREQWATGLQKPGGFLAHAVLEVLFCTYSDLLKIFIFGKGLVWQLTKKKNPSNIFDCVVWITSLFIILSKSRSISET